MLAFVSEKLFRCGTHKVTCALVSCFVWALHDLHSVIEGARASHGAEHGRVYLVVNLSDCALGATVWQGK
jgi:hypothetical protein